MFTPLTTAKVITLNKITTELKGAPRNIKPTPYWSYEGRNLQEIYDETYLLPEGEEF